MTNQSDNSGTMSRPRKRADSSVKGKLNRWEGTDHIDMHWSSSSRTTKPSVRKI